MPFEPGNQLGAKVRVIDKMIRSCLIWDEDESAKRKERSRLRRAIEMQLDKAAEGNLESLDWLTCRLEGKAVQSQVIDSTHKEVRELTLVELKRIVLAAGGEVPVGAIEAGVGTEAGGGGNMPLPNLSNEIPLQSVTGQLPIQDAVEVKNES